jgi:hypothetical protein
VRLVDPAWRISNFYRARPPHVSAAIPRKARSFKGSRRKSLCVQNCRHVAHRNAVRSTELATEVCHVRARRLDCAPAEPRPHVTQADQPATADLDRRKLAPGEYPMNCSAAEPETFSQMTYADQGAFNVRLHVRLPFTCGLPSAPVHLEKHTTHLSYCASARQGFRRLSPQFFLLN